MKLRRLGDLDIYRPNRLVGEELFVQKARLHLSKLQLPTVTREQTEIEISLQAYYDYCSQVFWSALSVIASRGLVEFLFSQLDLWSQAYDQRRRGTLNREDEDYYGQWGPVARLAIQFALEGCTKLQPLSEGPALGYSGLPIMLDQVMVAAEEMVKTSASITLAKGVFPGRGELRISLESGSFGFDFSLVDRDQQRRLDEFLRQRIFIRAGDQAYLEEPAPLEGIFSVFDSIFEAEHGISLRNLLGIAAITDESSRAAPGSFDVKFCRESGLVETVAHNARLPKGKVELALSGMTLSQSLLEEEDRELWRPKQQNRLLRRPFLRLPHTSGNHICWHSSNVKASLSYLCQEICFGRIPREWATPNIKEALRLFSATLDKEWEQTVFETLTLYDLKGDLRIKKLISPSNSATLVPRAVGEIDLLLFDNLRNALYVGEVKRIQPTYGPSQFRDDGDKFVGGSDSYVPKFKQKIAWVIQNWGMVCEHLRAKGALDSLLATRPRVEAAIITKYESIAQVLEPGIQIVSLRRLVEHHLSGGSWLFTTVSS